MRILLDRAAAWRSTDRTRYLYHHQEQEGGLIMTKTRRAMLVRTISKLIGMKKIKMRHF